MQMLNANCAGRRLAHAAILLSPVITLFLVMWAATGHAQTVILQTGVAAQPALDLVVDNLIAKNAERTAALQRYQSRRFYRLEYTGFPTSLKAEMVVDMLYEAPATKRFKIVSQSGPKWMIDRIFKGLLQAEQEALNSKNRERVALDRHNYEFSGMEYQDVNDGCSYVVTVQ